MTTKKQIIGMFLTLCLATGLSHASFLVEDNFDRADSTDLGSTESGTGLTVCPWEEYASAGAPTEINSNRLYIGASGAGFGSAYLGEFTENNYKIDVDITCDYGTGWTGIQFHKQSPWSETFVYSSSYILMLNASTSEMYLMLSGPGTWTTLISKADAALTGGYHNVELYSYDDVLTVKLDGEIIGTATDGTYTGGYITLFSDNENTFFNDLVVQSIPEPATLGLVVFGGVVLTRARRRK